MVFFFKQKPAYEMVWGLEFRRVLFRSAVACFAQIQWLPKPVAIKFDTHTLVVLTILALRLFLLFFVGVWRIEDRKSGV